MAKPNPISIRSEEDESKQVKKDLIKVLVLNGFFFAVLLGLFFWNRETGAVDQFFAKWFNF